MNLPHEISALKVSNPLFTLSGNSKQANKQERDSNPLVYSEWKLGQEKYDEFNPIPKPTIINSKQPCILVALLKTMDHKPSHYTNRIEIKVGGFGSHHPSVFLARKRKCPFC